MVPRLITLILITLASACMQHSVSPSQTLPAEFRHNQIFVVPHLQGEAVEFFTDTGGGWNAIRASAVEKLQLQLQLEPGEPVGEGKDEMQTVEFPSFDRESSIPSPDHDNFLAGRLVVAEENKLSSDGFLGGKWFANRVWEIDYPNESLRLLDSAESTPQSVIVPLGFQVNSSGKRTMHFPRITVRIDGEDIDLLLDTGATVKLTGESGAVFDLPQDELIGGSYITRSIFERWQKNHPDWHVIAEGDGLMKPGAPMIQVPEIAIGGITAGPVWFTQRPDRIFEEWMSQMMDSTIYGAIGGSGLKYYKVVIDYPGARAVISN